METQDWLPSREEVLRVIEALGEAWKLQDVDAMGNMFAEDATYAVRPFAADLTIFRGRDMIKNHWAEQLQGRQRVRRFRHHEHALLLDRDSPRCFAKWEVELEGLYRPKPMRVLQVAILSLGQPESSDLPPLITELETYRHSESNKRAEKRGVSPVTPSKPRSSNHSRSDSLQGIQSSSGVDTASLETPQSRPESPTACSDTAQAVDDGLIDMSHATNMSGPNLPRQRITEVQVEGRVHSWRGKYGWIIPSQEFDHPCAKVHRGRIYVHIQDLVGTKKLSARALCHFHVYSDADGLGAEECTMHRSGPTRSPVNKVGCVAANADQPP